MRTFSITALTLVAYVSTTAAQNYTLAYNNTQINVKSSNQYSGTSLIGYHVGAALSYLVARASGSGSSFSFNLSASSDQLLDNDIAAGYQLPCYVINTSQISNNSGPLECGAGDQTGYYDVAQVTAPNSDAPGTITFNGINKWYICAVQSFTYGWVQGTVVGLFGNGVPLGPGVTNCSTVDALAFAGSNPFTTNSSSTMTANLTSSTPSSVYTTASTSIYTPVYTTTSSPVYASTSTPPLPPQISSSPSSGSNYASTVTPVTPITPVVPLTTPYFSSMTTMVIPSSTIATAYPDTGSATSSLSTDLIASYTGSFNPVATYTGAASSMKAPVLVFLGLVFDVIVSVL